MPGRQGTFPGVNWNRAKPHGPWGTDVNHPRDMEVQYGMMGHNGPEAAHKEKAQIEKERESTGRQGRSLREFMEGKPVQPNHGHPTLF
jgi:hypothetical protein